MTDDLNVYRRRFFRGDVLVREGEQGSEIFLLERGVYDIIIQGIKVDSVDASAGQDFLGEVAAILDTPRTATVIAATDGAALCLPNIELEKVLKNSPSLGIKLVRSLCRKLSGSAACLADAHVRHNRIRLTGSTDLSLAHYMRGVLGLMEAAARDPADAGRLLEYFRATNPWGLQHGDPGLLITDESHDRPEGAAEG